MKIGRILIGIIMLAGLFSLVACSGTTNEIIKVGNPPRDIEPRAFTTAYMTENPYWKGSVEGRADDLFLVEFDIVNETATISSLNGSVFESITIIVLDDGSIVSEGAGVTLFAEINEDSEKYPISMHLITGDDPAANVFASEGTDFVGFTQPELLCDKTEIKCYDMDGDLKGDASYFVKSSVFASIEKSLCGVELQDYCEVEGERLAEYVCGDTIDSTGEMTIEYTDCNCQNGKCVEEIPEEDMAFNTSILGICITFPDVCANQIPLGSQLDIDMDDLKIPSDLCETQPLACTLFNDTDSDGDNSMPDYDNGKPDLTSPMDNPSPSLPSGVIVW